jgi:Holliday junction resolvasome RuvABC endonuclease subunit
MAIVVGVDAGLGVSSNTGVVAFDTESRDILLHEELCTNFSDTDKKIAFFADAFEECLRIVGHVDLVAFETFVMQGKGGQSLQKLIGGYVSRVPYETPVKHVFNTTVKRIAGGIGNADKNAVALGVLGYFSRKPESKYLIEQLMEDERWDQLDAFAIGIVGWELENA